MFNYLCFLLNNMGRYKISDLEKLSGVKAHTIRVWEQRYNILEPLRTETNIRYYNDEHLKKLLNVVSLMNAGNKISTISKFEEQEFKNKVSALIQGGAVGIKEDMLINQLVSSGLSYDENGFEKAFSNAILSFGLMEAYNRVFYPMLLKIGVLWSTSELNPAQEHFVSHLIKQKMYAAIDSLNTAVNETEKWVLFLPEGEMHDIGLLIANYGLRTKGVKVIYLGDNVPLKNLYEVAKNVGATHYLTFVVRQNQEVVINDYLKKMKDEFQNPHIYICCDANLESKLNLSTNQHTISSFEAFKKVIN